MDITRRLTDDTLTAEDREALRSLVFSVLGARDVAASTHAHVPGEWQHVVSVATALG